MSTPNVFSKQALALRIAYDKSISQKYKISLLSYISSPNILDNSIELEVLDLYLNNLISPPPNVVGVLLSTRFNLTINKDLCRERFIVFDVLPITNVAEVFNPSFVHGMRQVIDLMTQQGYNLRYRIYDAYDANGKVVWYDPVTTEMSVRWSDDGYTVRDFVTTCRMISMAKNLSVTNPAERQ